MSDLNFLKTYVCEEKTACQTLSNTLDISSARVAPDLLKALTILSDTNIRRSGVDPEDLKPYWKSLKRSHFSC